MINARKSGKVGLENSTKEAPLHDLDDISEIEFSRVQKDSESEGSSRDRGWTSFGWLLWEHRGLFSKVGIRTLLVYRHRAADPVAIRIHSQHHAARAG